jgi:hypothetical protein
MANTVIQLKYSTVTATPSSLNVAEPAYSYTSNIAYIGSPSGTGSIAIGGKFYLDQQANIFNLVNAAFTTANAAGTSTFAQAAFAQANAAFASANVSTAVNLTQNTSITAAFAKANTVGDTATSAFIQANAAFLKANTVGDTAAAAFTRANNSISANAGGTITGDLVVTGNLTISGQTTYANTTAVQLGDNIITLNADIPTSLAPSENAGFEINRGSALANASLLWIESAGKWQANSGSSTGAYFLANEAAATSAGIYANGAFTQANTAVNNALSASNYANGAFAVANTGAGVNLTQNTSIAAVFSLANGTAIIANTDVTNVNITSADYGNAASVSAFKVAANGRIISANSTAIAIDAGAVTSGTLAVARGGTGVGTHTVNGVLLGQGTSALQTASSSTEGHILTINNSGVPAFSHLQGGTF